MAPLRDLCAEPGPFASVYFDDSHDTEAAEDTYRLRWRGVRDRLAGEGASAETLDALDAAVDALPLPVGRSGHGLIAAGDRVLLDRPLGEPPRRQVACLRRLPHLMPLIEHELPMETYVLLVADATGADLAGYSAGGALLAVADVPGSDFPVHKVRGTGLSTRKAAHRVEETVQHNARQVAERADDMVRRLGARALVLAGERQARTAVHHDLSPRCRDIALDIGQGGAGDAGAGIGDRRLLAAARDLVASHARDAGADVTDRFHAQSARPEGLACHGVGPVTGALRMANAEVVLVADAELAGATVPVGATPTELSASGDLADATVEPAAQAIPAAAALTGASVLFTPDLELDGGVGALLRYRGPDGV